MNKLTQIELINASLKRAEAALAKAEELQKAVKKLKKERDDAYDAIHSTYQFIATLKGDL